MPYSSTTTDCNIAPDLSKLANKTAIITGGASGLGKAYVRALQSANVHVCIADIDKATGEALAAQQPTRSRFVHCDVSSWDDQVRLFKEALSLSPNGKIDYVVANAGIAVNDEVFAYEDEPQEPSLKTIDINIRGVLYTTKLAQHYFVKQNGTDASAGAADDTCLVLIGSGAAFLDCPRGPQYAASKWGARGIMHSLRRTAHFSGTRVNLLSPWYVRTNILPESAFGHVESAGVQFATVEDAGVTIQRILSDTTINGRMLFLSPRKWAPQGYIDLDIDDYTGNELLQEIQRDQLKGAPPEEGLFLESRW